MQKYFAIFPGQGSQNIGMLADFINETEFKENFRLASDILGEDLIEVIQNGPEEKINLTQITQPLILVSSYTIWQYIKKIKNLNPPKAIAGHSLGEYTALTIAEVLRLEDAIKITHMRGKLMQEAVPVNIGSMGVIIGLQSEEVINLCQKIKNLGVVEAVNFNSVQQTVISGHIKAVDECLKQAKEYGAKLTTKINVSIPSHCSLMDSVSIKLAEYFEQFNWRDSIIPIYQNYKAKPSLLANDIKESLKYQVNNPVLWYKSIEKMILDMGENPFIEIGNGKILAGLNKKINKLLTTYLTYNKIEVEKINL